MLRHLLAFVLTLAACCAPRPALAAHSFDSCTTLISALPAVISSAGRYCVDANLARSSTTGVAITINASDVDLDCNGYRLDGSAAGTATAAYGIYASNRNHVTVRNCDVRGFYFGVGLYGGSGHLVEDNRFLGNTFVGLRIDGDYSIARRNRVSDTGGSTANISAFAIVTTGSVSVLGNQVDGVTARAAGNGSAYGIFGNSNATGSINGNAIARLMKDGTGAAFGINYPTSDRINVRDNDLVGEGGTGIGIRCETTNGSVRDNMIQGFSAGINGCSNDGGNVNAP